ncbi:DNA adenine methylase [Agrobacterium tumefaciens]|uniref:DNA adenine methylase n=1 Tax=Agrobacterium tumefaciens TaxID=358 RepID=UPI0015724471|nr:DNA adenine methylase [Agrobacterium tumefaciens]WHO24240.1 DNA adenine methylase [Agrobacterium tumefaciens]
MKYMGSKRRMLKNGLGAAIHSASGNSKRFYDLFTGSASVAWHVSQNFDLDVTASDLQEFAVVLAKAVLLRTQPDSQNHLRDWRSAASQIVQTNPLYVEAETFQASMLQGDLFEHALEARELSRQSSEIILSAYGGYYFSPLQALWLDSLRKALPHRDPERSLCLGALIWTASQVAAAPGHTAQPFKPNATAGRFLREAWNKDVCKVLENAYEQISRLSAQRVGSAIVGDANSVADQLQEGDLAFIDPPYSGVHYSRFYHVLETVAVYESFAAEGEGRYPPAEHRARSLFSLQRNSSDALDELFRSVSRTGASAIVTFPAGKASNGLSGEIVKDLACNHFQISSEKVSGRFSTMGGNSKHREARMTSEELILTLRPRANTSVSFQFRTRQSA